MAQSLDSNSHTQRLSPGLYIVATPIGNLRDITLRALDTLKSVDLILAEDTRHSAKLMQAYNISTPMQAYHDHNVANMIPKIITRLKAGDTIAQISDAGTPLISDPGYKLVRAAVEAGISVYPLPGASAVLAALMVSGLPTDQFTFIGFLPNKARARRTRLTALKSLTHTLVFFESPRRSVDMLKDAYACLGERPVIIARELTKTYETVIRSTLDDILEHPDIDHLRGEIVIIIGPGTDNEIWDSAQIDKALADMIPESGLKTASQIIADMSGWSKRDVYQRGLAMRS